MSFVIEKIEKRSVEMPESITLLGQECEGVPVLEEEYYGDVTYAETWIHYTCDVDGVKWGVYASLSGDPGEEKRVYACVMRGEDFIEDLRAPADDPVKIEEMLSRLCDIAADYKNEEAEM